MTQKQIRRSYSNEFKHNAVALSEHPGRQVNEVAEKRGSIPAFIHISVGKLHDVNALDLLIPEAGSFYVMDRGYLDFGRLFKLNNSGAFFVTRAKSNTQFCRRYSRRVDKSTGLRCDQTIVLTGEKAKTNYPQPLRRVKYHDTQHDKTYDFLTNNVVIPAKTVADLYRHRWKVELFFMDQTASPHQVVLRHIRKCSQNSGMDRNLSVCVGRHHQEKAQHTTQSLHNSTDFERDSV